MSNPTPGPWIASKGTEFDPERWSIVVDGPLQFVIAEGHNGTPGDTLETEEANARLMAAAPELLAALQAVCCLPWSPDKGPCCCLTLQQAEIGHADECKEARAAIAKATGGPQ